MPKRSKHKKQDEEDYIIGLFGIKYPKGYRYKITTESELREVKWLIKEGDFDSIEEYEYFSTKQLLRQL